MTEEVTEVVTAPSTDPRLIVDISKGFVKRKVRALELQRKETRLTREGQQVTRWAEQIKARADAIEVKDEDAPDVKAQKEAQAEALYAEADAKFEQADRMFVGAAEMLADKVALIVSAVDAVDYPETEDEPAHRVDRPKADGKDRDAFEALVTDLLTDEGEDDFNAYFEVVTGVKRQTTLNPTKAPK